MDPICRSTRDWLAFEADAVEAPGQEIRAHLAACAACATWLRLHQRQASALRGLENHRAPAELDLRVASAWRPEARELRAVESLSRLHAMAAPANLDGTVVAALHAGSRQERSLRHLSALDRLETPPALDAATDSDGVSKSAPGHQVANRSRVLAGPPSPAVLERLVSEDLVDLPRALTRRFTSKLLRLSAPAELDARVRFELAQGGQPERGRILGLPPLAAVAAALLMLGLFGWTQFGSFRDADQGGQLAALDFEIRHLDAGAAYTDPQVDPLTQRLADELSNSRLSLADSLRSTGNTLGSADPEPDESEDPATPGSGGSAGSSGPGSAQGTGGAQGPAAGTAPDSALVQRAAPISRDLLARMESAHLQPVYLQRLVELYDPANPALDLVYQEELVRDGHGGFAVSPGAVLQPSMTPAESATFSLLQGARQGYVERHRDFRVRDVLLFRNNYSIVDLRQNSTIAGVPCVWLEVQNRYSASISWRLAVDDKSGMILSEERVDQNGALLARIETVVIDFNPDLSNAVLDGGPSAWQPVSGPALAAITVYVPTLLPDGYQLFETAKMHDALGREWVRQLYSDGIGELFFLHELKPSSPLQQLGSRGSGGVLNAFSIGGATVLDGEARGVRLIALGLLSEQGLLQLIDSALP